MHRIDAPGHDNNSFVEGNPSTGVPATTVGADFLNALQEEIASFIEAQGLVLDKNDNTQFKQATEIAVANSAAPVGAELPWYGDTAPTGWLLQDGAEYSMTTYNKLDNHLAGKTALNAGVTCTFDDSAETANAVGHGLANDTILRFTNSGGALPPAITARYARFYVVNATADTFQLSLTKAGAPIDIVGTGTGTHYFHTKFTVPDPRGRVIRFTDGGAGVDPDAATRTDRGDGVTGDNVGTKQADAIRNITGEFFVGAARSDQSWSSGVFTEIGNGASGASGAVASSRFSFDASTVVPTGGDNRMTNEGRNAIIKY